jgi:hypothetical protein
MSAAHALSRRAFLKLSALAAGGFFLDRRLIGILHEDDPRGVVGRGRVTIRAIYRYQEPTFSSQRVGMLKRDEILDLYEELDSPAGPAHNPRWYRLSDGWAHSAYLQRVDGAHLNHTPIEQVPEGGLLAEVTVPSTRSYRAVRKDRWAPLYYLYYQSLHWITAVDEGLDGNIWYRLTDDLLNFHSYVPAAHLSPIPWQEYSPISPSIPAEQKRIEVSIDEQTLTAYENEKIVLHTKVSTGLHSEGQTPNGLPTDTPTGYFRVQTKMPSRHMGDGELTDELEAYELLGVPWVSFFHKDGIALHGTYWHNNFGRRMSHGCINLRVEDARFIYRWTNPLVPQGEWYRRDWGTRLAIG